MKGKEIIIRAKHFCAQNRYRWTDPREKVISVLANTSQPIGAYQIIELLSSDTATIKPPSVYRAIAFWAEHGFIHRIESLNAYIICCEHSKHTHFCIFICKNCSAVQEIQLKGISQLIKRSLRNMQGTSIQSTSEVLGLCSKCQSSRMQF